MANTVKLKRSAVQGKVPAVEDLQLGELALNTFDGKAYIKKDQNGTEEVVEIGATAQVLSTARTITEDVSLGSDRNILSINDVVVADGVTVDVPDGCTWIVVA